jgi:hemoglobin
MQKNLYERLGGYDPIAAVFDDFLGRQFTEMLCEVTGGPAKYIGRDMRTAHAGLGITGGDWQAAVKNLTDALDKFKVPQTEKDGEIEVRG